jgi:predicted ATPase/DNA-binding winged helix-turn-helix (wHTH) protein
VTPLSFGHFEIRPPERKLLIDGCSADLGARAFDVLMALAERTGQLLTKNQLLDIVWPNTVVDENNLQVQIHTLRKLLGPEVIATIPGRGYTFTATQVSTDTHVVPAATMPPAPTPRAALGLKTNLSERLPALIGREEDLADLETMLQDRAVITVVGAGGIGKTLLVQHLLDRQRSRRVHGVCFVELASLGKPGLVVGTVAAALGVPLAAGGGDPLDALVQAVAPLSLLLALDNAEHLLEEVARVAHALHAGAPQVTLLVTSQAPLHLDIEQVYRLGALALPEAGAALPPQQALGYGAVALFAERARRVDRRFALSVGNVATVVSLCRRLDGLPLAIGLAAARVPLLGIEGLAAALDERLKLLTSSRRDVPAKHRTLRAALEWSHGLLDAHEQAVFRRLGVIEGSGSLELIRSIATDKTLDEWTVLDALSVLVERSLVMLDGRADETEPRYRLLGT